jgi:hypothetical protein
VAKSTLPFAGRGLFASRNFVKGEMVSISPVLLLPKDEVAELASYSDSVLQNYCIASSDSNIVLLPLGLGALANHAMAGTANVKLEIFWWESLHPNDDIDKMRKLNSTLVELSQEKFAQLDIAYRATRDIHEGEEVTYDYGEDWINSWATHLAKLNDWLVETAAGAMAKMKGEVEEDLIQRPRFLSYIEAPKNLYLDHWKDKAIEFEILSKDESVSVTKGSIENLVGKEIENFFGGFGSELFVGKIISYNKDNKKYAVKYADGYEQECSLSEIKKYLIRPELLSLQSQPIEAELESIGDSIVQTSMI